MNLARDGQPLNPMRTRDRMCRSKRPYRTLAEMTESLIRRNVSTQLYAYKCPYGDHFHFTKHSRIIDPELQDRVNIPLVLEKEKP